MAELDPPKADNLRAELGREPLRLATLAARTWGLAGPSERDVTDRLRKRIGREFGLRFWFAQGDGAGRAAQGSAIC